MAVEVKKSIGKRPAPFKPKNMHGEAFDCYRKAAEDADDLEGLYVAQRWGMPPKKTIFLMCRPEPSLR
jgi:hypothetical protein